MEIREQHDPAAARSTKWCPKCSRKRLVVEFADDQARSDGLKSTCRECDRARSAAYYAANRGRVLERQAEHYRTHGRARSRKP